MIIASPGAILIKIGALTVRWYGVIIGAGFLLATYAATRLAKNSGLETEKLVDCGLVSFIGGIIGARLYHVALQWQVFAQHPEEIMAIWLGGLSIHGGLVGGLVAGYIFCKLAKFPFVRGCDIVGSVLPLAQAVGRWGNFFNSEAFGTPVPADFPIKLFIPEPMRPSIYKDDSYFHPTFLYECIWDLSIFALLYFVLYKRLNKYPGVTFFSYITLYSIGRLLIEPLRTDSIMVGTTPVPVLVSILLLIAAPLALVVLMRHYKQTEKAAQAADSGD